ncbi:hypothetical protein NLY44_07875 [Mesorhizobium sp. C089B]|uniref:hypothetical protein n=1 Tax=Mesorhizobium sp. C089B TaxID=2956823 RepID=UPI002576C5D2|nr:hypothetical protein [Mesorhizobium sp. C089B]WJI54506.1 hypothetical protein NLY44_07875 [Mesorhizobium sp. C089B]
MDFFRNLDCRVRHDLHFTDCAGTGNSVRIMTAFDALHGVDDIVLPRSLTESPQPIGRLHAVERRHLRLSLPATAQRILLNRVYVFVGNRIDEVVAFEDRVIEFRWVAIEPAFNGGQAFIDIGL